MWTLINYESQEGYYLQSPALFGGMSTPEGEQNVIVRVYVDQGSVSFGIWTEDGQSIISNTGSTEKIYSVLTYSEDYKGIVYGLTYPGAAEIVLSGDQIAAAQDINSILINGWIWGTRSDFWISMENDADSLSDAYAVVHFTVYGKNLALSDLLKKASSENWGFSDTASAPVYTAFSHTDDGWKAYYFADSQGGSLSEYYLRYETEAIGIALDDTAVKYKVLADYNSYGLSFSLLDYTGEGWEYIQNYNDQDVLTSAEVCTDEGGYASSMLLLPSSGSEFFFVDENKASDVQIQQIFLQEVQENGMLTLCFPLTVTAADGTPVYRYIYFALPEYRTWLGELLAEAAEDNWGISQEHRGRFSVSPDSGSSEESDTYDSSETPEPSDSPETPGPSGSSETPETSPAPDPSEEASPSDQDSPDDMDWVKFILRTA